MVRIGRARVVLLVARVTERAGQVVVVVDVAIRAGARRHQVRVRQSKSGGGVIEFAIGPLHRIMTSFASKREARRLMRHGTDRIVVVRLVARHACRAIEAVIVVNVAVRTLPRRNGVTACQRESGTGVVERRIHPVRGVVTCIASLREIGRHVVRIRRALIILQMARHACRAVQAVVVVDVAIGTLPRRHRVLPG